MALLFSLPPPSSPSSSSPSFSSHCFTISLSSGHQSCRRIRFLPVAATTTTHNRQHSIPLDKSSLAVAEASEEDQLWAAACLRVRSFYDFQASSYGIHDHKRYLAEREFVALKERIAGKREGFKRVSCINATLPLSQLSSSENDLCAALTEFPPTNVQYLEKDCLSFEDPTQSAFVKAFNGSLLPMERIE
ncbi:hypothetical protein V6Z11_D08G101400 [Gossypium hirsutum]|uniref:Uncharacterized protein n=1 Tax=Gossypium tomentosum TaxID=34277 RepID=A0A5D2JSA1_GOSTO|nr:hypothetical protein ES332_D08G109300v1 [Gossypium tomentosum]TYH57719.1 hypothetical protein ES332_D08G109300v1 [Gossypium tomentosum]